MMGGMQNAMRLQAMRAIADRATVRVGIVSGYDPSAYAVKVRLQPEDVLTGWIPLASPWIGNGWGLFAPPSIGDSVTVHFIGADIENGYVEGRFFNDIDRPLSCPSGEFWLVHASGSLLKFHEDGTVELHANTAINSSAPAWNHAGPMNVTGDVTVTGNIVATADIKDHSTKSMAGMRSTYNDHHHGASTTPDASM